MASLVFKPRDSDIASLPYQQASITSNKNVSSNLGGIGGDHSARKRNSEHDEMQHHFSHPSFGPAAGSATTPMQK